MDRHNGQCDIGTKVQVRFEKVEWMGATDPDGALGDREAVGQCSVPYCAASLFTSR